MRTLLIGSLVTLALAVAACGSSDDSASTSTPAATAAKQPAAAPCDKANLAAAQLPAS